MTTNQRYFGLNRRFDKRARRLIRAGFTYMILSEVKELGAVFTKTRYGRRKTLVASFVMHADNCAFLDHWNRRV